MRTLTGQQCPVIEKRGWALQGLVPAASRGEGEGDCDERTKRDAQAPDTMDEDLGHVTVAPVGGYIGHVVRIRWGNSRVRSPGQLDNPDHRTGRVLGLRYYSTPDTVDSVFMAAWARSSDTTI